MDCWKCKWSREIPGDTHLRCVHPKTGIDEDDALGQLLSLLGNRTASMMNTGLKVKINPHGLKNGWANHPFNFDPIWIEECEGFEEV